MLKEMLTAEKNSIALYKQGLDLRAKKEALNQIHKRLPKLKCILSSVSWQKPIISEQESIVKMTTDYCQERILYKRFQFLQNWSDCLENLTRQRHDREQTENQQNAATVDSCFELVGSRQLGVAQQKVEQPTRVEWSTKCTW